MQHERKPIVDKKETLSSSASTSSTATSTTVLSSSLASSSTNASSPVYQRGKLFNHSPTNVSATSATTSAAVASAAAAALSLESVTSGVFPVGFNFAELTQTLSNITFVKFFLYTYQVCRICLIWRYIIEIDSTCSYLYFREKIIPLNNFFIYFTFHLELLYILRSRAKIC